MQVARTYCFQEVFQQPLSSITAKKIHRYIDKTVKLATIAHAIVEYTWNENENL